MSQSVHMPDDPGLGRRRPDLPGRPLPQFAALLAVNTGLLALVLAGPLDRAQAAVALALHGTIAAVALWGMVRHYPHPNLGLCNAVTLFRAMLISAVAGIVPVAGTLSLYPDLAWITVGLSAAALMLDGVDGWAARRSGLQSAFGARFDMEVDSIFALILMLIVLQTGKVGAWVILLGVARYLFVVAMRIWPWLNRPTPPRYSGKVVCVVQIAVLIALIAPVIGGNLAPLLAGMALAGVIWSFGVDIVWLWRRR